jgi:hypothetical protein
MCYLCRAAARKRLSITGLANWNSKGQVQDWFVGTELSVLFSGPTELKVSRSESLEIFAGQSFRKNGTDASFYTEGLKGLGVSASYAQGTDVNYHPAPGLSPFLANSVAGLGRADATTVEPNAPGADLHLPAARRSAALP